VPSEAVQWDGSCHVVFVRDRRWFEKGPYKFLHTRTVRPGVRDGKYTEIIVGVLPGEVVAAKGSGVLRSQLLKNNLGAG
jgi:cobalt-zinc-cadmium efflux system membrane fusion protein